MRADPLFVQRKQGTWYRVASIGGITVPNLATKPAYVMFGPQSRLPPCRRSSSSQLLHQVQYNTILKEEMSPVKVPPNLPDLVRAAFQKAKANGDVNFYPTHVAVLTPASTPASLPPSALRPASSFHGLAWPCLYRPVLSRNPKNELTPPKFQLRFSPSLANKPKPPPSTSTSSSEQKKPFNPFENPPPQLTVCPIGPSHTLVLNKFAIVPEHAILITRTFQPQAHLLDADDLAATYACLRAYHDFSTDDGHNREELFAFFNCGEHSGASQPHRHLQLLPVARMRDGLAPDDDEAAGWRVLADRIAARPDAVEGWKEVPFVTFAEDLGGVEKMEGAQAQAEALHTIYRRLYRRACHAAGVGDAVGDGDDDAQTVQGEARISYNLAMTKDAMVICPRTAEGGAVVDSEGREVGTLSLNGTVLAGTALVKSKDEWEALRGDPAQLWEILGKIGVPSGSCGDTDTGRPGLKMHRV